MTKSEFQDLQGRAATSGVTLKAFLKAEGVAYSTYNYWSKKIKAESESLPMAPISIRDESPTVPDAIPIGGMELPGVMVAFPNGVKAHFGKGSERILLEVLSQSLS